MAENIATAEWFDYCGNRADGPARGAVHAVVEVRISIDLRTGRYAQFLRFARFGNRLYHAGYFRKVTPRADAAERGEAAFVARLRRKRPAVPAPVLPIAARLKGISS